MHQSPIALATGARLLGDDGGDRADVRPVIAHGVVAGSFKKRAAAVFASGMMRKVAKKLALNLFFETKHMDNTTAIPAPIQAAAKNALVELLELPAAAAPNTTQRNNTNPFPARPSNQNG